MLRNITWKNSIKRYAISIQKKRSRWCGCDHVQGNSWDSIFLYRDDYYTKETSIDENTSKSEFIIAKHRNGPTTTVDLIFKRNTSTFVNMLKED